MSVARRKVGPVLATAIVAGNMIGSGVFLLPAALATVGSVSLIGWFVGAMLAALLAGVYAALASVRPAGEGLIDYPANALHPAAGFLAWAAYWSSGWVGNVAILIAALGYLKALGGLDLSRGADTALLVAIIWGLALANLAGPRAMGRFAAATLAFGLLPIAAAALLGAIRFDPTLFAASWNTSGEPALRAVAPIVLSIFWAFLGLESANTAAAVVDNPERNVPIAAIGGVLVAALVYAAAISALFGLMPAADLAVSSAPFADAASALVGPAAGAIIAAAALARTLGCGGGWILVTAESGRAGAARGFLPKPFSEVDPARRPIRDVFVTAGLMSIVAVATASPTLNQHFVTLIDFSVLLFLLVYALSALSLTSFARTIADPGQRWLARGAGLAAAALCAAVAAAALFL